jgi:hypothetical protein
VGLLISNQKAFALRERLLISELKHKDGCRIQLVPDVAL